jgi:uncharacterized membrane protein YdjX (TVP38/TMEM64 family)
MSSLQPSATKTDPCAGARERPPRRVWFWVAVGAAVAIGATLLWRLVPWDRLPSAEEVSGWLRPYRQQWYALPATVAAFVVLGFLMVPVLGMITVAGLVFGPWLGSLYALTGTLTSAAAGFAVGRWMGQDLARRLGCRFQAIDRQLGRNGVVAAFLVRKVPAPFTLVNIAVGSSRIRFVDFLIGTVLGMGPIVIVLATVGSQLGSVLRGSWKRAWPQFALLVACLAIALVVNQVM